jgi:nicotinate-nucleotide pyrophosphorylase (carboxylating)
MHNLFWQKVIKLALEEDIGIGDVTSQPLIMPDQQGEGIFLAKDSGIIAGIELCQAIFKTLDEDNSFIIIKSDGEKVRAGEEIARVKGNLLSLLAGERVALNFLQRMSGIATRTRKMVDLIADTDVKLLDTRKTTPGLRCMEKYAVRMGGGCNHRFNLSDGVLIKDNHIKAVGSVSQAIKLTRQNVPHTLKIEIEVENLEQLQEALQAGADIIMLDNMDIATMEVAVKLVAGRALLEASGGVNEENLRAIAATGVDFISVGALTHSVKSLDISFNII